jgi:mRNA-degrading endonuclease RelE of RelBE toxin-antitoxin system
LRWGQPGRGKRGGVRIIYYVKQADGVIWMLTIYAKNEASEIAPAVLRQIKEEIDG